MAIYLDQKLKKQGSKEAHGVDNIVPLKANEIKGRVKKKGLKTKKAKRTASGRAPIGRGKKNPRVLLDQK